MKKILKEKQEESQAQTIYSPAPSETKLPQNISIDQKVDRLLVQYEREAVPTSAMYATENRKFSLLALLFEADNDLGGLGGDPAGGGGGGLGALGGDAPAPSQGPDVPTPKINLNLFAESVARLVNNFTVLVNPKMILLNRVQAFITKNYSDEVAKELMITLETNYNLSPKLPEDKEGAEIPLAVGALSSDGAPTSSIGGGTGGLT